jgi:mycoredoxin
MFCLKLRLTLRWHHLRVHQVNIWKDPEAAAFVRSVADGNETVPVLVVGGEPMVNPEPRNAVALLRA